MKVKDLIEQLQKCDPEAYVTDRECRGIDRIMPTEYLGEDDAFDGETTSIVMLHAGYASGIEGE